MSLHPQTEFTIPPDTQRVANAAFPEGNSYMHMRNELGIIYQDKAFSDLFPRRGQPALSPAQLALVTAMQFAERLSDRAAADAVRARIDWKYALGLSLENAGFDASVLSEFRARLLENAAELQLLETLLERLRQAKLLKAGGRMRTDSTHVLAAVRDVNRLEMVGETVRQALNLVATVAPTWLQSWVASDWFDRYQHRFEEYRLPKSRQQRYDLGEQIGRDGFELWERLAHEPSLMGVCEAPALEALRQIWVQQYYLGYFQFSSVIVQ